MCHVIDIRTIAKMESFFVTKSKRAPHFNISLLPASEFIAHASEIIADM